ncbi:hypothetical protein KK083_24955 [Fulvivirgaceae bacterium PWU4]|uniref:Uncharacterized protein n=1 Tax=Chryseosolibacter histidini TaxID=2782349 RepID=A0AAP2GRZ7_9BACT|nr:hypothetical protein [Chryseosolibacter histidini]MBT1700162.1 hypothetical protein [Chryseosolibacter histidini]
MNKFLKVVWSVNGILILLLLLGSGVALLASYISSFSYVSPPEVIVGEALEEAKAKGLILQGLTYEQPRSIMYTDHFLLPVSIRTYENPRQSSSKLDLSLGSGSYYSSTQEYSNVINVVFLNRQMEPQTILLDKKGFIDSFQYPGNEDALPYQSQAKDTLQRHITYLIAFEDSNKDGAIDGADNRDLYLSDLNGANLKKITTNVDVTHYYFLDKNRILIKFQRREKEPEEHRKEFLALYAIKESKLTELSSLHETLNKIESIIVK